MNDSTRSRRWPVRSILLGVLVVAVLLATPAWAPTRVRTRANRAWQVLTDWLLPTRWVWPAAIGLMLLVLFTPLARRRWPTNAQRISAAISLFVGLVVLAGLTTMSRTGAIFLTLGIVAIFVVGLLLVVPRRLAPPVSDDDLDALDDDHRDRLEVDEARVKLRNDLRTTTLQAIAGLAVLAGAYLGFQQLTEDHRQATATQELTRQGQIGERFSRAINQLGSDSIDVRLGGLYELEQLADQETQPEPLTRPPTNAAERRLTIVEVVAAYVREHAQAPRETKLTETALKRLRAPQPPPQDVVAALTILSRRPTKPDDPPVDLRRVQFGRTNLTDLNLNLDGADFSLSNLQHTVLDRVSFKNATFVTANLRSVRLQQAVLDRATLTSATLVDADLRNANLHNAVLNGALLKDAKLQGVELQGAKLNGAKLERAILDGAILDGADLSGAFLPGAFLRGADLSSAFLNEAYLGDADLRRADLHDAQLQGAILDDANLGGANLSGAHLRAFLGGANLRKADLRKADLRKADLRKADLSGADLRGADLGLADLHDAIADQGTTWPDGFDRKGAGVRLESNTRP